MLRTISSRFRLSQINLNKRLFTTTTERPSQAQSNAAEDDTKKSEDLKAKAENANQSKPDLETPNKSQGELEPSHNHSDKSSEASPEPSPEDILLQAKISDLKEKLSLVEQDILQSAKRHAAKMEDLRIYSNSKFGKDLLDLVDNLDRVSDAAGKVCTKEDQKEIDDLKLSLTKFLAGYKIEKDSECVVGKPFNPNRQEAMFEVPLEHMEKGSIAHVLTAGWMIGERVLRAARVGVVRKQ
jgi:molecular chaperone GrpE